jgi:4-hydroxybenzoate polyprenyltransferase
MIKVRLLFLSLRPKHWVKNLFIFAGPFFSLKLFNLENITKLIFGFLCWCLITSAMYLFNDIIDRREDALHPDKKNRPITSGKLGIKIAYLFCALLSFISLTLAVRLNINFAVFIALYFLITVTYSLYLKHIFILDVMCIAAGFVFRVVSGAFLIQIGVSEWLIMCTFLLSSLLGFSKRQEEITALGENAVYHRKVLKEYDRGFLQYVPYVLVSSAILCYMLYTVSSEAIRKFGTKNLIYTTPFVIYGLLRYVYIAYEKNRGADPTQVLFQDVPTVINILLWILTVGLIIYLK